MTVRHHIVLAVENLQTVMGRRQWIFVYFHSFNLESYTNLHVWLAIYKAKSPHLFHRIIPS